MNAEAKSSLWAGACKDFARKIVLFENLEKRDVFCEFDAMKMVSIYTPISVDDSEKAKDLKQLRAASIWFPTIPREVCKFYPGYGIEAQPNLLCESQSRTWDAYSYIIFGDEDGKRLERLTKIIACTYDDFIHGVELRYGTDGSIDALGTVPRPEQLPSLELEEGKYDLFTFVIDGPGGEKIVSIDRLHGQWRRIIGFRVHTNFGRVGMFAKKKPDPDWSPNEPPKEELVIGFYTHVYDRGGFDGIGIITVPEETKSPVAKNESGLSVPIESKTKEEIGGLGGIQDQRLKSCEKEPAKINKPETKVADRTASSKRSKKQASVKKKQQKKDKARRRSTPSPDHETWSRSRLRHRHTRPNYCE
ncbi:hypothetical protein F5Y16DRAFT_401540 [Xylariaceae sp. FL0255]|nr:hypothetical protein F5Y16DRAFT_401540 [Xylariaceae sp. FL0255]